MVYWALYMPGTEHSGCLPSVLGPGWLTEHSFTNEPTEEASLM